MMNTKDRSQKELAKFLVRKRSERDLTQEQVSERSEVSVKTIQRTESGEQTPSKRTKIKIFNALNIFGVERFMFGLEEPSILNLVSNGSDVFEYLASGRIADQDFFYDVDIDPSKARDTIYSFLSLVGGLRNQLLNGSSVNKFDWFQQLDEIIINLYADGISIYASVGNIPPDIEAEQTSYAYSIFLEKTEPRTKTIELPNILYTHYKTVNWIPLEYDYRNGGYNIWKRKWDPIYFKTLNDIEKLADAIDRIATGESKVVSFSRNNGNPFKLQRYGTAFSFIGTYSDGYQCNAEELYALQEDVLKTIQDLKHDI